MSGYFGKFSELPYMAHTLAFSIIFAFLPVLTISVTFHISVQYQISLGTYFHCLYQVKHPNLMSKSVYANVMQVESGTHRHDSDDENDSLFGSPPPSPSRAGRSRSPSPLALPGGRSGSNSAQNVGTLALPGSHLLSELPPVQSLLLENHSAPTQSRATATMITEVEFFA